MDILQDIMENTLPPFQALLEDSKNIKVHPYYTGPFEVFEENRSSDVIWDLDPLLRVIRQHSQYSNKILEVGCGSGRVTSYLARQGFEVLGVDSSKDSLTRFSKRLKSQPDLATRISITHGDFLSTNCNIDRKFDTIVLANISINSFWNTESVLTLLKRVKTLLKSNGAFCFGIFADETVEKFTVYKGQSMTALYEDSDKIQRIMWAAIKFDLESQLKFQTTFLESLPEEKNDTLGHISVFKEKIWSLSTIEPLLQVVGFSITDKVECNIEGGGGSGWRLFMVAAKLSSN
jgi:SAM-dependent methyltransferase